MVGDVDAPSADLSADLSENQRLINSDSVKYKPPKGCIQSRYVLAWWAFCGFFVVYSLRVNLSVAMVAMVNQTDTSDTNKTGNNSEAECSYPISSNSSRQDKPGEFNWSSTTTGVILGSFFYGYIVTQVPGGWIAARFGGKWVFGLGVLCTAVLTLVTPLAARYSVGLFIAVRVLEGLGEGVTFPAMHAMWGNWAPPLERSKLGAFTYTGAHMGTVFSLPISGFLCDYAGWPSVFYVFGALGCVWFLIWILVVHDTPDKHPRISHEEKFYIEGSLGKHLEKRIASSSESVIVGVPDTPWCDMFLSIRLWACLVAHTCSNWGFYTLLTSLPAYMKYILKFNLQADGVLSALPYLAYFMIANISAFIFDVLRRKGIMSTTSVRKFCNFVGLVGPALFLLAVGWVGCDQTWAVVFLVLSVGTNGISLSGYTVNHLDIAPRYAGALMGITNSAATIPGFLGPFVVGVLTDKAETRGQWMIVFYISAAIYGFGALFFLIFGSGDRQPWNDRGIITETFKRRISIRTLKRDTVNTERSDYGYQAVSQDME
ncbi:sialin-like [Lineus longissimus]|uniref:sialin-like n=1 Tax=Lineus longissimus TaxID=88925 RepID=UPI00315DC67B